MFYESTAWKEKVCLVSPRCKETACLRVIKTETLVEDFVRVADCTKEKNQQWENEEKVWEEKAVWGDVVCDNLKHYS